MFGMSSKEFWEDDPQLYWAYRTFYLKQKEFEYKEKKEQAKYESWLIGNASCVGTSVALNNSFSKKHTEFPRYDEFYPSEEKEEKESEKKKKLTKQEINLMVQNEFNAWARY